MMYVFKIPLKAHGKTYDSFFLGDKPIESKLYDKDAVCIGTIDVNPLSKSNDEKSK